MPAREVAFAIGDALRGSPRFLIAPLIRPRHLRWGATTAEVRSAMPGDELVPQASFRATRAITINAPARAIWPWLVQVGFGRAGFYSYDLFDNGGRASTDRILPEYQEPQIGDWIPMASNVNQTTAFKIAALEPNRSMLWAKPDSTWAWTLTPLDDGGTRVVTRLKARYRWRSLGSALLSVLLLEVADFPMMRKMLLGVKARAETRSADRGHHPDAEARRRDDFKHPLHR